MQKAQQKTLCACVPLNLCAFLKAFFILEEMVGQIPLYGKICV